MRPSASTAGLSLPSHLVSPFRFLPMRRSLSCLWLPPVPLCLLRSDTMLACSVALSPLSMPCTLPPVMKRRHKVRAASTLPRLWWSEDRHRNARPGESRSAPQSIPVVLAPATLWCTPRRAGPRRRPVVPRLGSCASGTPRSSWRCGATSPRGQRGPRRRPGRRRTSRAEAAYSPARPGLHGGPSSPSRRPRPLPASSIHPQCQR